MATPKIKMSQMSVATTINATDFIMIVQDGINKKSSITNLLKNLNSVDVTRINPLQFAVDFSVATKTDANSLFVDGSLDNVGIGTAFPQSKLHVNGNCQVGSSTTDGIILESTETVVYTADNQINLVLKALSPSRSASLLSCNTGVVGRFSLPSGSNGQLKSISINTLDAGKSAIISLPGLGFNTLTFTTIGSTVLLRYFTSNSLWVIISNTGAAISTI
jgi:hypothetical protein